IRSAAAQAAARCGREEEALDHLARLAPWLELAPRWAIGFPRMACEAAHVLWLLERVDHIEVIEDALRTKVIASDFRHSSVDGRHGLALVCALTGRHDEALEWFAAARTVLAAQGARPLLAVCDFDEALMYARRREPGDVQQAAALLESAAKQFEVLGMTGWIRRAAQLEAELGGRQP
ncbi:MAG: hypothetical protein ACRD0C_08425, partial [Acidimicrobiia bacterium]